MECVLLSFLVAGVAKADELVRSLPHPSSVNDCARSVASFANLKAKHVGVFTDPTVAKLPVMKVVRSPFA
jgi:hypothetical protein